MKKETAEHLLKYYKWLIHLSLVIIGVSISLVSSRERFEYSDMLVWGIILLSVSVFFNWLCVKRLTITLLVDAEQVETKLVSTFLKTQKLLSVYGLSQNWTFIVGCILVIASFIFGENVSSSLRF